MGLLGKVGREIRTVATLARVRRRIESLRLDGSIGVADAFETVVDRAPASTALRFESETWTYGQLDDAANRVAHWAHACGMERGDVVALLMENRPEYLATWIGLAKAGVQSALLNTNLTGAPLAHAIGVAGAKAIVVGSEMLGAYETAHGALAGEPIVWIRRDPRSAHGDAGRSLPAAGATGAQSGRERDSSAGPGVDGDGGGSTHDGKGGGGGRGRGRRKSGKGGKRGRGKKELAPAADVGEAGGGAAGAPPPLAPYDLDAALAEQPGTRAPREWRAGVTTGDNLFYIYTSGTTGLPKAARFSHFRFLQAGYAYTVIAGVSDRDVVYCCLPLYHTAGGVIAVAMALLNGGALALRRKFSASAFWDDCRAYDVTIFQYIGELCRYLLNRPESAHDRRHRVRCAVGNGLRPDIWERFQKRFGIRDIREFYGATEGNFAIVNLDNKVGSVGRVPPYLKRFYPVEVVRFDVEAETHPRRDGFCIRCGPGEIGEAIGRIPAKDDDPLGRFEGYSDDSATGKKVLHDVFEKGDAWYRTGDLLTYDAEGYFYFIDRIGDTFRWKGENVATSEVAEVISTFEGVAEANVYGVRVPGAEGRAGMAAIVTNGSFDLDAFYRHVTRGLPAYARPLFLRLQTEIQTTATLKHRKVDLVRDGFDPSAVTDPLYLRDDAKGAYVPIDAALYDRIAGGVLPA